MSAAPDLRIEACEPGARDPGLYRVIRELRTGLDPHTFEARWRHQAECFQYQLIAASIGAEVTGVMGVRPVATLSRGRFLHIDDLVVHPRYRRQGVGTALLDWAESHARLIGLDSIYLDSLTDALEFYRGLGYLPHGSVLVRKVLDPDR